MNFESFRGKFKGGGAIYSNFEGESPPKKRNFLGKTVKKVPKNAFFGLPFQQFVWRAFEKFWEDLPPPRENARYAPGEFGLGVKIN